MTAQSKLAVERWRPPYLRSMLDLKIDQSVHIYPEAGDTLEALWERVNRQAARYQKIGRYFHRHKRTDYIFILRVDKGHQGKLAPFLRLGVGEKMLCEDPFDTEKEKKNLRRRLLHLLDGHGLSIWLEQHADGNLYYRCIGKMRTREPLWSEHPVDDGSELRHAKVVCCPFELKPFQEEFGRIKRAILATRIADIDVYVGVLDR